MTFIYLVAIWLEFNLYTWLILGNITQNTHTEGTCAIGCPSNKKDFNIYRIWPHCIKNVKNASLRVDDILGALEIDAVDVDLVVLGLRGEKPPLHFVVGQPAKPCNFSQCLAISHSSLLVKQFRLTGESPS